jgi:hypothetical protein
VVVKETANVEQQDRMSNRNAREIIVAIHPYFAPVFNRFYADARYWIC